MVAGQKIQAQAKLNNLVEALKLTWQWVEEGSQICRNFAFTIAPLVITARHRMGRKTLVLACCV